MPGDVRLTRAILFAIFGSNKPENPTPSTHRDRPEREPGDRALDLVHRRRVTEDVSFGSAETFQVVKLADVDTLIDKQIAVNRGSRSRGPGRRIHLVAARVGADHDGP